MNVPANAYPSPHAPSANSPSSLPTARVSEPASYQSPIPSASETSPPMRHASSTPLPPPSAMVGPPQDQVNGISDRGNPPTLPPPSTVTAPSMMSHSPATSSPMSTSSIPAPSTSIPRPPTSPSASSHSAVLPSSSSSAAPPSSASSQQQQAAGYRPLNVRDALSYLDQVKVKFSDQPDVYNRFLDIMKDFKSQA
jgi:paired amphipathic helix protein Sin3a